MMKKRGVADFMVMIFMVMFQFACVSDDNTDPEEELEEEIILEQLKVLNYNVRNFNPLRNLFVALI